MAIKNFSFFCKNNQAGKKLNNYKCISKFNLLIIGFLVLSACQSIRFSKGQSPNINTKAPVLPTETAAKEGADPSSSASSPVTSSPVTASQNQDNSEALPTAPIQTAQRPRLGLILGPGALRSYAHAGLLQELAKAKIPISMISGIETAALPAALYASRGQPFEAEWQMMKLKESDWFEKSIISGNSIKRPDQLLGTFKEMFGALRVEDSKITFVCPSYSVGKKQTYLMNKGSYSQLLLYCIPSKPLMRDYQGNGANVAGLGIVAQNMRQKGVQVVMYVDLIAENNLSLDDDGLSWGIYQSQIQDSYIKINELIKISGLGGFRDYSKRRENLQKGQEAGRKLVQTLQTKYGF